MGRSKAEIERCKKQKAERLYWKEQAAREAKEAESDFLIAWSEEFADQWVRSEKLLPLAMEAGIRIEKHVVSLAVRVLLPLVKAGDVERKARSNSHVYRLCV